MRDCGAGPLPAGQVRDDPRRPLGPPRTALQRPRHFDIDVSLVVRVPEHNATAWHELVLEIDGRRQWHRRIASHCPGQTDGLDYHCQLHLEAGPALRIRAVASTQGSAVKQLLIEAREVT